MSKIANEKNEVDERYRLARNQIEHRASWLALIFDEMKKAGVENAEEIVRKAIRRCGNFHGERHRKNCADPNSCIDFGKLFFSDAGIALFNMTEVSSDYNNAYSSFNYCALVDAWLKLGFDDETIELLCDIAMDGDRGVAESMGLTLSLKETIASGCSACKLHFCK
jgi:hypothetical protein